MNARTSLLGPLLMSGVLLTTVWMLPALATSGMWGLGDGAGLPDTTCLAPLTCELGFRVSGVLAWRRSGSTTTPLGLGYGRVGLWPGVDLGLTYGWPGQLWPLPGARWRLVEADLARPWSLAVGWNATAETGTLQQTGYLVTSRELGDYRLAGGCIFDPSLQTRLLGAITWRFGRGSEFQFTGRGPGQGDSDPRWAASTELAWGEPWRGLVLLKDQPEGTQIVAGGGARFRLGQLPVTPEPPRASPPPATPGLRPSAELPASGSGRVQPPGLPRCSVIVRVVDEQFRPLSGMRVELSGHDRHGTSNVLGYAICPNVPVGSWNIVIRNPDGSTVGQQALELRDTEPVMVTIPVGRDGAGR